MTTKQTQTPVIHTAGEIAAQCPVVDAELLPNGTGSYKLMVWNREHGVFDPNNGLDMEVRDYTAVMAGLEALAKYASGTILGSPKLILVAPKDKFGQAHADGSVAHIHGSWTPQDSFEIEVGGIKRPILVLDEDIPDEYNAWARVKMWKGELYTPRQKDGTVEVHKLRDANNWPFFYSEVASALLQPWNLQFSLGPYTIEKGRGVYDIIKAADPVAAKAAWSFANRENSRMNKAIKQETQNAGFSEKPAGPSDYDVPLKGGGVMSLAKFHPGMQLHLQSAAGVTLRSKSILEDTDDARRGLAAAVRNMGAVVVLQ